MAIWRQQAEEQISLDARDARLGASCALCGLDLVAVVVDAAVSAAKYRLHEREGGAAYSSCSAPGRPRTW